MQYTFNVNLMLIELLIYGFDPIEEIEIMTSFKQELLPRTFHQSNSVTQGLAKLLTLEFAAEDRPLSNPNGPDRQGSTPLNEV